MVPILRPERSVNQILPSGPPASLFADTWEFDGTSWSRR